MKGERRTENKESVQGWKGEGENKRREQGVRNVDMRGYGTVRTVRRVKRDDEPDLCKCHASPKIRPLPILYICTTHWTTIPEFLHPSYMFDHWSR